MVPWVLIDTAALPDGGELRLLRRGAEYSIMTGATELMNSRLSGSEAALATLTCTRLADRPAPHILIGGFGMGFTLRAALQHLRPEAQVTVGEVSPSVIAWARGPMAHLSGGCLNDARVTILEGDVGEVIREASATFDAILLDVDNGPDGLSRVGNDRLYDAQGLSAARRALRPGGVLAVWSAAPSAPFVQRLGRAGFGVEERRVRATGGSRGARHTIWLATSP